MIFPLLQRERSIDDFVDSDRGCRLSALLADKTAIDQEQRLYAKEIRGLVHEALVELDERERHIIRNRFGILGGDELTLDQIGKSLNLSRERVRQLERDAKQKLRINLARVDGGRRYPLV
jgi:RNA polymerase sigma factor (sigma-70 family)